MFVRPFVRRFCDFCDICLYSLNMALHGSPLLLTEENQVLILEPSSFFIQTGILYRLFSAFFKNCKKVHEWYLAVKCEKANKWTHFLSVKTFKNTSFWRRDLLIYVRLTSPKITFYTLRHKSSKGKLQHFTDSVKLLSL